MDILSSRVLLQPSDPARTQAFYRDTLGLAVYREYGDPANPGLVFFAGGGLIEVPPARTEKADTAATMAGAAALWFQVRDVAAEHARLAGAGVPIVRPPAAEPWGLIEMWIADPAGTRIVLVQVPDTHPLRRDPR
ncbi:MAG: Glyoxalase/bleomycin resistance protein/dioxygenase [Frankiales bacterium]|nr:Glyoxalase/bleomycin resistance protein/dioxygenase [Frankiales bacterium]